MGSSSTLNLPLLYPTLSSPAITLFSKVFSFLCLFFNSLVCNNALFFCFSFKSRLFLLLRTTYHIDCLQPSMSSAGMCWWLPFIKTFMCALYAAITRRGCGWSKSICHMSKISVHKFTGRFSQLSVYSAITALSKWCALLDKSWKTSCFSSC